MEGEILFSRSVSAGTRVYYIDVRKDKKDQRYVTVSEVLVAPKKERHSIFIFSEKLEAFAETFSEVLDFIKKEP